MMSAVIRSLALAVALIGVALPTISLAQSNRVMQVSMPQDGIDFNGYIDITQGSAEVNANIYRGLMAFLTDDQFVPDLAETWTLSEDGLNYRFDIREDAAWSDGTPITAESLVASYDMMKALDIVQEFSNGEVPEFRLGEDGWLEVDMPTVAAEETYTIWLTLWTPVPVHLADRVDFTASWIDTPPQDMVFSGPYTVLDADDSMIQLRPNPHYSGPKMPQNGGVDIRLDPEFPVNTLSWFRTGEIDATYMLEAVQPQALAALPPDTYHVQRNGNVLLAIFNTTKPPFDQARLRRALAMAAHVPDHQSLGNNASIRPAISVVLQEETADVVPPEWTHWTNEERIAQARAEMVDMGYGADNTLSLMLLHPTVTATNFRHQHLVRAQWNQIFVETSFDTQPYSTLIPKMIDGEFDVVLVPWIHNGGQIIETFDTLRTGSDLNVSGYSNPVFDEVVRQMAVATSPEALNQTVRLAQMIVNQEAPLFPLFSVNSITLTQPGIAVPETEISFVFDLFAVREEGMRSN